ncbi:hypothetical protein MGSAQ_000261 [marine sediment metagenome]|uniref:Uncharacterized protein n=1 Tax=marine sediment metagenome TaxID=412755 RepID=A0A1B6NXW6_9ZZZZ
MVEIKKDTEEYPLPLTISMPRRQEWGLKAHGVADESVFDGCEFVGG